MHSITNRTNQRVYVARISLKITNGRRIRIPKTALKSTFFIEAHEPKEYSSIFPIEIENAPKSGNFRLEVIPTAGRKSIVKGDFPLDVESDAA